MKRLVVCVGTSLCACTLSYAEVSSQEERGQCGKGPHHMRVGVRYTTPEGIGYKQGYTTLEAFFASPKFLQGAWLPFLDLRGHIFDNGKLAANAGVGCRYLGRSHIWGVNAYYDYRNTNHQHYNQVAAGLESLSKVWDFRVNAYLPVGKKETSFSPISFAGFHGHYLLSQRSRYFCMKGANAEAAIHVDHFKSAPLYFAAGPYYLTGKGATTWGGEVRARVDLLHSYLRIEGNSSYDHFFKWIGQAQVSINIPFGRRNRVKRDGDRSCGHRMTMQTRSVQPVDRFEIIPAAKQNDRSPAINPETGQPWYFWFVDNTSSSEGTYESPYPTLLEAQNASAPNQVIYLFPGDGTTRGVDNGIFLKDEQMLLGASVTHPIPTTRGVVIIPPLASSMPMITNGSSDVVTLANNNLVSGLSIATNYGQGITGTGVSNPILDRNMHVTNAVDINGIFLQNPSGQVVVTNSTFSGFSNLNSFFDGDAIRIYLDSGGTLGALNIVGNSFSNIQDPGFAGGSGILAHLLNGTISNVNISECTFSNISTFGAGVFFIVATNSEITNLKISNSSFADFAIQGMGIGASITGDALVSNMTISGLDFQGFDGSSRGMNTQVSSNAIVANLSISGSNFENFTNGSTGFNSQIFGSAAIENLEISGNSFTGFHDTSRGISHAHGSSASAALSITSNNFSATNSTVDGYGANLSNSAGTICLEFLSNNALPVALPNPYAFTQTGGTFNRTVGSDGSTNTGQFSLTGVINPPGSCSQ